MHLNLPIKRGRKHAILPAGKKQSVRLGLTARGCVQPNFEAKPVIDGKTVYMPLLTTLADNRRMLWGWARMPSQYLQAYLAAKSFAGNANNFSAKNELMLAREIITSAASQFAIALRSCMRLPDTPTKTTAISTHIGETSKPLSAATQQRQIQNEQDLQEQIEILKQVPPAKKNKRLKMPRKAQRLKVYA